MPEAGGNLAVADALPVAAPPRRWSATGAPPELLGSVHSEGTFALSVELRPSLMGVSSLLGMLLGTVVPGVHSPVQAPEFVGAIQFPLVARNLSTAPSAYGPSS